MKANRQLQNTYVKAYYDTKVGKFDHAYSDARWHSSPENELDYIQTKRALQQAFGASTYQSAIEIGPGDGAWTSLLEEHVSGTIHLVEQSEELFKQLQQKYVENKTVTLTRGDWLTASTPESAPAVMAVRCIEYFSDKKAGLKKVFSSLEPGGKLIMVSKNRRPGSNNAADNIIHGGQLSKVEMLKMLRDTGFEIAAAYPATFRLKSKYVFSRWLFDLLHQWIVRSNGKLTLPFERWATESYLYVATRPQ